MKTKKYMDIEELSRYISSTKSTIYSKKCRNQIPFIKIGSRLLFEQESIDNWVLNGGRVLSKVNIPIIKF